MQFNERYKSSIERKMEEEMVQANTTTSKSTAANTMTHAAAPLPDIAPVDIGARRLSWTRLMLEKKDSTPVHDVDDSSMRTPLLDSVTRRKESLKRRKMSDMPLKEPTRNISVHVLIKNLDVDDQAELE